MLKHKDKLKFYTHVLPGQQWRQDVMERIQQNIKRKGSGDDPAPPELLQFINMAVSGIHLTSPDLQIFDCRQLPFGFVYDTGYAYLLDALETGAPPLRLPHPICYFEYERDCACSALEARAEDGNLLVELTRFHLDGGPVPKLQTESRDEQLAAAAGLQSAILGVFNQGGKFNFGAWDILEERAVNEEEKMEITFAAVMLLGTLALLEEHFVADRIEPDPSPKWTKYRRSNGRLPQTGPSHVLTVNVAALRTAARNNQLGSHESPLLHWRRGHRRVLHRGSEFEKSTWVNRCLVGDPDKGYQTPRDIELVWRPQMIRQTQIPRLS